MEMFNISNPYIATASGRIVHLIRPVPSEISIYDIAVALSKICRYTGHTSTFYSVAQHCCLVSDLCPESFKLWGLLHDASEAYLGDVNAPLKGLLTDYREIETRMMNVICDKFGLDHTMPPIVKNWDSRILYNEVEVLLPQVDIRFWRIPGSKIKDLHIYPWRDYEFSQTEFLERFSKLF